MKDFTYKEKEFELIRHLLQNPPHKIWWGFSAIVFDYTLYYIMLLCEPELAETQNEADEAMTTQLFKRNEQYVPHDNDTKVCENRSIEEAYIVRTLLYFTEFEVYASSYRFITKVKSIIKCLFKKKVESVINDLEAKSYGGNEQIVCHPESEEAKNADPNASNLIDVGLLLKIDGKYLTPYLETNSYGFDIWTDNNKYLMYYEELDKDTEDYQFIKVDMN